jgi:cyclopropane fatty-acyl-phospholipid synthase-like methyltransferase
MVSAQDISFRDEISSKTITFETDVKFDIVLNRWFLHHLTTNNKKDFFIKCKNLTKDSGVIFSIDYFFKKFSNITERLVCATEYNQYRSLYSPEPNLEKFLNVVKDIEVENYRGGKMDSIDNIESMLKSLDLKVEYEYTSDAS